MISFSNGIRRSASRRLVDGTAAGFIGPAVGHGPAIGKKTTLVKSPLGNVTPIARGWTETSFKSRDASWRGWRNPQLRFQWFSVAIRLVIDEQKQGQKSTLGAHVPRMRGGETDERPPGEPKTVKSEDRFRKTINSKISSYAQVTRKNRCLVSLKTLNPRSCGFYATVWGLREIGSRSGMDGWLTRTIFQTQRKAKLEEAQ